MKSILCLLLIVASCSFQKSNQKLKGHEELYSEPEAPNLSALPGHERRIVIAATNDFHGVVKPAPVVFNDDHNKGDQNIRIGGADVVGNYINTLKSVYKNDVVLVDSGDIFANGSETTEIKSFYESMNYDAVTVGLRDFNLKVPAKIGNNTNLFQQFAKDSEVPLLLSNLYELKTARVVEWKGVKPYVLKDMNGVKVGIIGLVPDDIVSQTPVHNRVGLYVESAVQSTLRYSRLLRSLGADIIVVLTHQGIDCVSQLSEESKLPESKVNFDPKKQNVCEKGSQLGEYLDRLPPSLVDVVVGGRIQKKMANFVNGTLVLGGFPDGKSLSYAEFVVDKNTKKVNADKTVVHQPVMFCSEFFKETNDCFTEDESVNHKHRIPAKFLGKPIVKDPAYDTKATAMNSPKVDFTKALTNFKADITFFPPSTGETQLVVLNFSGRELFKLLEEDFNQQKTANWQPSPFLKTDSELSLLVSGLEIDLNKTYRVLTDLESAQKHHFMMKKVANYDSEAFMANSWKELDVFSDEVSVQLAAEVR